MQPRSPSEIASYHAHIYFRSSGERAHAAALREAVAERFRVRLGFWREGPVGPHGAAMYQVAFAPELFQSLVNAKRDHLLDAVWIGTPLPLHGEVLPEEQEAELAGEPNTDPTVSP
ncbi:MAG: aromatic ring-cleaving dioxygenase [Alphaproteobacteria bacterium]|nr:MAG: aromatic ring-cleaving dioxygenase [Alphaproteobacteria bacterium]